MLEDDNFIRIGKILDAKLNAWAEAHPLGQQLLYTRRQAAIILAVSTSSIDILINRGELRIRRWGSKRLIPHEELVRVSKKDFSSIWPEKGDKGTRRKPEDAA